VRVEFSKKQLITVRPRNSERFLFGLTVEVDITVSEIENLVDVLLVRPSMPSRCRCRNRVVWAAPFISRRS